jgi:hypothetical protein
MTKPRAKPMTVKPISSLSVVKRRTYKTYFLQCAGCHAMARVKLETLAPVTGGLRCLACGGNHVLVYKRRRFPPVNGVSSSAGSALKN